MPLDKEIDAASKEFLAAIKDAEDRNKQLSKQSADLLKAGSGFSSEIKRTAAALNNAQTCLEAWTSGTERWIEELKSLVNDFATYKKKSVVVEKFFNDLKEEKDERDKARKKQGGKPTKEDEIRDAAFQRAKTAYDNDPGRTIESVLKQVDTFTSDQEKVHARLMQEMKEALADYDKLTAIMSAFTQSIRFSDWKAAAKINTIGSEFDDYFKGFR